jgi:hypothetical protein
MKQFCGCIYRLLWYTDFLELAVLKIFVYVLPNTLRYHQYLLAEYVIDVHSSLKRNLLFIVCWPVAVLFIWNWSASEPTFSFFYDYLYIIFSPFVGFHNTKTPVLHCTAYLQTNTIIYICCTQHMRLDCHHLVTYGNQTHGNKTARNTSYRF